MKTMKLALLGLVVGILSGCGAGGSLSTSPEVLHGSGSASFVIRWPARSRLIPLACNSIKAEIRNGDTVLASEVVDRPTGEDSSKVVFASLPPGQFTAHATAFPETGAGGVAQAAATSPIAIQDGKLTELTLSMASTIDRIEISPVDARVIRTLTQTLTATARNADGEVVLVPAGNLTWEADNTAVVTVDASGTITGVSPGTAQVAATERESGKIGATSVTVASPDVIYVNRSAPGPVHDGLSWETGLLLVQQGIDAGSPGEVWVAAGVYKERITMKDGVELYGGFAGTETSRDQRDWQAYETILDGNQEGTVVTVPADVTASARLDGFTVENGLRVYPPTHDGYYAGGVDCWGSPVIAHNTIRNNSGNDGGGICCRDGSPTVANNVIIDNLAVFPSAGGGIFVSGGSGSIVGNVITGNSADAGIGGGIAVGGAYLVACNVVAGNRAYGGGGISAGCEVGESLLIAHNTIVANTNGYNTMGLHVEIYGGAGGLHVSAGVPVVANNVISFCSSGVSVGTVGSYSQVTLNSNCVFGNTDYNYSGTAAGTGDLSVDPQLVDWQSGNYHLKSTSPCIDAGDDSVLQQGWMDIDGEPRIKGAHVDIGADEY